jgi:hypothetical protein
VAVFDPSMGVVVQALTRSNFLPIEERHSPR